jgi:hypothetical protein
VLAAACISVPDIALSHVATTQAVASGDLKESPSSTGAVAEAGGNAAAVAVAAAAAAMAADGAHRVPVQVGGTQQLVGLVLYVYVKMW